MISIVLGYNDSKVVASCWVGLGVVGCPTRLCARWLLFGSFEIVVLFRKRV